MITTIRTIANRRYGRIKPNVLTSEQRADVAAAIDMGYIRRVTISPFNFYYEITRKGRTLITRGAPSDDVNPFSSCTIVELQQMRKTIQRQLKLIEELL